MWYSPQTSTLQIGHATSRAVLVATWAGQRTKAVSRGINKSLTRHAGIFEVKCFRANRPRSDRRFATPGEVWSAVLEYEKEWWQI